MNPMIIISDCVDQVEKLLRTLRLFSETLTVASCTMFVTAFYRDLSLFTAWEWRAEDFRGDHLTFRRTKWGISRN